MEIKKKYNKLCGAVNVNEGEFEAIIRKKMTRGEESKTTLDESKIIIL